MKLFDFQMNISSRDISAFLALAELKNFTRAASRCHLSQPAFSALIKALEDSVGLKLFDRNTRHVLLTREGERFMQSALRIQAELQACEKTMRNTASLAQGHVSVALLPSLAAGWLPGVLRDFVAQYPGIDLDIMDVLSEPCINAVAHGQADFALAAVRVDTPDLQAEIFCSDDFHLVCRKDHPLAEQEQISLSDLLPYRFIHLARHSSVRQYLEAALFPETLHTLTEVEQLATVMGLVQANLGITAVPALTLFHFDKPDLLTRPLAMAGLERHIYLVRKRGISLSVAAQALYRMMLASRPEAPVQRSVK